MKILIATSIFPPETGGPASYVPEIIKRLKDKYSFCVLTFTPNPDNLDGAEIYAVTQEGNTLTRQFDLVRKLLIYGRDCEVFFAQDPIVAGLATVVIGKLLHKKVLLKYVGDPAWETAFAKGLTGKFLPAFLEQPDSGLGSRVVILLTRLSFLLADKIIVPSKFLADIIFTKYQIKRSKITLIYNAIDLPKPSKRNFKKKNAYRAIYFGRLVPWKKVDGIIEAVALVNKKRGIGVKLVVVGDGQEKANLEKLAAELQKKYLIAPFVRFLGRKRREETLKILADSNLFILNSIYEGLPHSILESFSVGTPVVCTDIPGTDEIALKNKTALTISPGDIRGLSGAISRILENEQLATELSGKAQKLIAKAFNWDTSIKQLDCIISED